MGRHAKIKASAESTVIGYNNSAAPLGARTDHDELGIIAHESGRQDYKDLFDVLPSLDELKGNKVDAALNQIPGVKPTAIEAAAANQQAPGSVTPATDKKEGK